MKKILAILLISLLAACGGGDDDDTSGTATAQGTLGGAAGASNEAATDAGANDTSGGAGAAASGDSGSAAGSATQPGDSGTISPSDQDGTLLANAFQLGLGEIELAKLAVAQASDESVRRFARRMLAHHTYMNEQITTLAQGLGLSLPTAPALDFAVRQQNLAILTGAAFDRAYIGHNVAAHQLALAGLRTLADLNITSNGTSSSAQDSGAGASASSSASASLTMEDGAATSGDTGSANAGGTAMTQTQLFAANALPVLQTHLLAAKALAGTLDPAVFLVNLYQDGLGEIQLSTQVLEQTDNAAVRAFAQRMIDDHTQANSRLVELARTSNVTLPTDITDEQRAIAQELAQMTGNDFDKAYMNHNVLVHEIAVVQAQEQAARGAGTEIGALAASLLPTLLAHREQASILLESIKPSLLFGAFQNGMGELLLSHLALQLSENAEVRQFARSMIDEHNPVNAQVMQLARENGRRLPSEVGAEAAGAYLQLSQLAAQEFDRAFMNLNVLLHGRALQLFEAGQANQDEEANVRAFAVATLPVLRQHHARAGEVAATLAGTP